MEGYEKRYAFFEGYSRAMCHMTDAQELEFRRAMDAYAFKCEAPSFTEPILMLAWDLVCPSLDKSLKLSNAGRKGGRGNKKASFKGDSKGALKGALKPTESHEFEQEEASKGFKGGFREAFNEEEGEEEGEVENERHSRLLSFYKQTVEA